MAFLPRLLTCPGVINARRCGLRWRRFSSAPPVPLQYSVEVQQARLEGRPLVALESTIITHGMPYPQNLETAQKVESIIRDQGATPATIAVLAGQVCVGLSSAQLSELAQTPGAVKTSRRDLAHVLAGGMTGATTVSGTIVVAELADIPIFVTGGIGGVHRNGEISMDVSADLTELGRSPTLVVCSGAKAILDIGRTLEYLETQGVCVCTLGEDDEFPAFYSRRSGHRAPHHAPTALHAARLLQATRALRLRSGLLVAVPIPVEHAVDEAVIESAVTGALLEAAQLKVQGKHVTPFLLAAVAQATAGVSLQANIALIKNNAKVGAQIAVEFSKIKHNKSAERSPKILAGKSGDYPGAPTQCSRDFHSQSENSGDLTVKRGGQGLEDVSKRKEVVVIGGANVDRTYRLTGGDLQLDGSTHACTQHRCAGGVARNMAEALRCLGVHASLLTALGDDADGHYLAGIVPHLIIDGSVVAGARTASYAALLDAHGECRLGLGDMAVHDAISTVMIKNNLELIARASLVVIDGNAPQATVDYVLQLCHELRKPVFFEPTDKRKAIKAMTKKHHISFASPNMNELHAMAAALGMKVQQYAPQQDSRTDEKIQLVLNLSTTVMKYIDYLIVTLGKQGVAIIRSKDYKNILVRRIMNKDCVLSARFYPSTPLNNIKNVSGAGDCFASGFIHGMLMGVSEEHCVAMGFKTAEAALYTRDNVPKHFGALNVNAAKYDDIL